MTPPQQVFADATEHLDDRNTEAVLPARHRINPNVIAQPVDGTGYVYGQVGWLDDHGTTYGLRLPDAMHHQSAALRALYLCLGQHGTTLSTEATAPPTVADAGIHALEQAARAARNHMRGARQQDLDRETIRFWHGVTSFLHRRIAALEAGDDPDETTSTPARPGGDE